jgi:putative membrane protein
MSSAYLWIKAFHIVFVMSWFAGLFYLPRFFVNLAMISPPDQSGTEQKDPVAVKAETDRLLLMARKLYRFMGPLMVLALALGIWLWLGYGVGKGSGWLPAKMLIVIGIIAYHIWCGKILRTFENSQNKRTHKQYRWINEAPVLALMVTVVLVVVKPF